MLVLHLPQDCRADGSQTETETETFRTHLNKGFPVKLQCLLPRLSLHTCLHKNAIGHGICLQSST